MRKSTVPLCLFVGLCASVYAQQPSKIKDGIPAITRKTLPAVGLILVSDSTGKEIGQGSGFVVSPDGKVVTNYHVIEGAASAIIKFSNGAFFGIEGVLGLDQERDLVILKASGRDFPYLPLGNSGSTQVGEQVIAIGNPLSLEGTVSTGIVSAIREVKEKNLKVIQTTAPISPGSSGGVLLNLRGQVIGVTAFRLLKGENLNFAIAAEQIRPLLAFETVRPFAPEAPIPVKKTEVEPAPGNLLQQFASLVDTANDMLTKAVDAAKQLESLYEANPQLRDAKVLQSDWCKALEAVDLKVSEVSKFWEERGTTLENAASQPGQDAALIQAVIDGIKEASSLASSLKNERQRLEGLGCGCTSEGKQVQTPREVLDQCSELMELFIVISKRAVAVAKQLESWYEVNPEHPDAKTLKAEWCTAQESLERKAEEVSRFVKENRVLELAQTGVGVDASTAQKVAGICEEFKRLADSVRSEHQRLEGMGCKCK